MSSLNRHSNVHRVYRCEYLIDARLAQLVERKTLNLVVVGSSPTVGDFSYTRNLPDTHDLG